MMKRFSAVIFDCDGVMFDSRLANIHYYNQLLEHFHLPPVKPEDEAFVHMQTAYESVRRIFEGTPYEEEAQAYRMNMDYAPFIADMLIEPGLTELLSMLKPWSGLAVATNRSNTIRDVLLRNGLESFFDIVVSSLDVLRPKPHPECIEKILRFFEIGPDKAVYVGDSSIDSETARAANVSFVAYKNPQLTADFHAKKLLDIADWLEIRRTNERRSPEQPPQPPEKGDH